MSKLGLAIILVLGTIMFLMIVLFNTHQAKADYLSRIMRDVGTNPTGWRHKWCGYYLRMRLPNPISSNRAIDWRSWGRPSSARPGAVAVMRSHVGVVTKKGCDARGCHIISGNHSGRSGNRKVGTGYYSHARIITFRAP